MLRDIRTCNRFPATRLVPRPEAKNEIIADLEMPASQTSLPMTYMREGEQYVVFTVGGGREVAEL